MAKRKKKPEPIKDRDGNEIVFSDADYCREDSPDCTAKPRRCWHRCIIRQVIRRWLRQPDDPIPQVATVADLSRAEYIEREKQWQSDLRWMNRVRLLRSKKFLDELAKKQPPLDDRLWSSPINQRWGGKGGTSGPIDIDGTGSWGRHVRQWEDRADEP